MDSQTPAGTIASRTLDLPLKSQLEYDGASLAIGRPMTKRTCLAIVLAAGEGTRMRSALPKVLHAIAGRSLLAHVLAAVRGAGANTAAVVVGPDADAVADEARRVLPKAADLRPGRTARHRACGAGGARRDRRRARTTSW